MAKRKKRNTDMPMPYEPDPKAQRKWAAESLARTIVETMPGRKKMVDHITEEVMKAGERAEKSARPSKK